MAQERGGLTAGMSVAIFMAPVIFGWTVMRNGFHPAIKIVVGIYMLLSLIPLYFLIAIFWTSGGEIKQMAKDFDHNRAVASRNADVAKGYMDSYSDGSAPTEHHGGMYDGMNAAGDMVGQTANNQGRPGTAGATRISIDAGEFAKALEKGRAKLSDLTGHSVAVSGTPMAAPQGNILFLAGGEQYPAVKLVFSGTVPAGSPVHANCDAATMGISGPEFTGCR